MHVLLRPLRSATSKDYLRLKSRLTIANHSPTGVFQIYSCRARPKIIQTTKISFNNFRPFATTKNFLEPRVQPTHLTKDGKGAIQCEPCERENMMKG